jgi:HlyD family secretion protein
MSRKRSSVVLVLLIGLLGALGAWRFHHRDSTHGLSIAASGTIEATQVDMSAEISSPILTLLAEEGDRVEAGAPLIELDTALLRSEKGRVEALVVTRQAELHQAEIDLELKKRDYERFRSLLKTGGASRQQADQTETAWKLAAGQVELAHGLLAQAESSLHYVETQIMKSTIISPLDGVVLLRLAEPGEVAIPGRPLLTLGDLENLWVRVYVLESEIGKVKLGQPVRVLSETYSDVVYNGSVIYIAQEAEFTPRNVQTRKERARLVFAVKIAVENPRGELKPGLPVDVEILVDDLSSG